MCFFRFKAAIAHYRRIDRILNPNPGICYEFFGPLPIVYRVLILSTIAFALMLVFSLMFIKIFMPEHLAHHTSMEDRRWHKNATFYEIFPASFKDTDSDGYGDFEVSYFISFQSNTRHFYFSYFVMTGYFLVAECGLNSSGLMGLNPKTS